MWQGLKTFIQRYLYVGISNHNSTELNRQIFVINLFSVIGLTVTFTMAIPALYHQDYLLAGSLFTACVIFYSSHLILRFGRGVNRHRLSSNLLLACLVILMLYLVYGGGANATGPLWIYLVPPVALFFGGLKKGLINTTLFTIAVGVMLFFPNDELLATSYTIEFKTRLLYSFITAAFLSGFYEYSRHQSYEEIQELSDKFEQQARQDPLTKLANRRGMTEHLIYEVNRSKRSKLPMTLILADVDHFKKVNDNYGHDAGDSLLIQLAESFIVNLRKQDIVARWGGEEFLFLLPETNAEEGFILAEKIRQAIQQTTFTHQQHNIQITMSFGVSEVDTKGNTDNSINMADQYLYLAKKEGRNQTKMQANVTSLQKDKEQN